MVHRGSLINILLSFLLKELIIYTKSRKEIKDKSQKLKVKV